jgi:hypothetical protein
MPTKIKLFCITLFIVWLSNQQVAAQKIRITFRGADKDSFLSISSLPPISTTYEEAFLALQQSRDDAFKKGYLAVSIDSIEQKDSEVFAHVFLGKKYEWAKLKNKNIPENLLLQSRFDERKYIGKPVEVKNLYPVFEKITRYFEDNGFPFCSLYIDSLSEQNGQVEGWLTLDKGPLTKIDTIIINEDVNISRNFVLHYLGLKQGSLYNE